MKYSKVTTCRCCKSSNLDKILNLGKQPLANSYHTDIIQDTFPLSLNLCLDCWHLQLSIVVKPELLYKEYLYVSGTTKTLRRYFKVFAEEAVRESGRKIGRVLDIACNDGSQLDAFQARGWQTYGVDPAENLHALSTKKGHRVRCEYWGTKTARQINHTFDVITAQNVFAHTDDVDDFLQGCQNVMEKTSTLYIQTSQADMVLNNEFDTIYHEHLSYFSINSMQKCLERNGMSLVNVYKAPVHGNSFVFVIKKGLTFFSGVSTKKAIEEEKNNGLHTYETYIEYARKCKKVVKDLGACIKEFRKRDFTVVGYGAAAKGNTLLNFGKIDLDYIVDDNSLKWGLLTPGRNIEIRSPVTLKKGSDKLLIVPLAWNFFTEIKEKVTKLRKRDYDTYIKYFPSLEII